MEKRRLGRTGHESSVAFFGAVAFWWSDQPEADAALNTLMDYGVNHIDVAPQYGNAQERVGNWLPPHRDRFFLGCKTLERDKDAAWADLENSLRLLKTDHVDLYQMHAVATMNILDQVVAPGGALETLRRARDEGKTRFLGLTSHGMEAPNIEIEALRRFDFDTVMFPLNPRLYGEAAYRASVDRLLALCQERDVGVQIIKAAARRPWQEPAERRRDPWYEPYQDYENIKTGVDFVLSMPGVATAATVGNAQLMPTFLRAAANFTPMDRAAREALVRQRVGEEAPIFKGIAFVTPD
jgi:aryl-alcohol dehydrogenase-like predicted oxidoreductase